ncbi:hypothetical protein JANAI62_37630 [Jannaschia pagri]|uniref:Uncharacterized protein n=1 Tax=Jannaschia pagri TaxID=2829797 RepID=A0ABQ4NS62_9RHOB|nr:MULTISPECIES: hypothetical protein [unclassified Jannaschia]GIT93330.1 hypothetical protein JANAI61_37880 [Jannaschia sp. AI_61]GIT97140.1 hypothetical protein JANAI62_37630 [Jannaschia sp. AI_62]
MINLDFGPVGFVGTSLASYYRRWGAFISVALFPSVIDGQPILETLSLPTDPISAAIWESAALAALYLLFNIVFSSNRPLEIRNAIIGMIGPGLAVGAWFGHVSELPVLDATSLAAFFLLSRVSVYLSAYDYIPTIVNVSRTYDTLKMARRQLSKKKDDDFHQLFYGNIEACAREGVHAINRAPKLANFVNGVMSVLRDTGGLGSLDATRGTTELFASLAKNNVEVEPISNNSQEKN